MTGSQHRVAPDMLVREVIIIPPDDPAHSVRLLTTLLDLDASIIGLLYRYRWQVELFFRWLKCYARFDHLISHNREGGLLNFYVAVVGVTLMYLHMGCRPSKYMFSNSRPLEYDSSWLAHFDCDRMLRHLRDVAKDLT